MCDKKKSYVIQTHARPPMAAWGSSSGTYLWLSCPAPASIEVCLSPINSCQWTTIPPFSAVLIQLGD